MATYNGEKYVAEQIDSILNQTYDDFVLLIKDDGSNDNTIKIIKSYCKCNHKIKLIEDCDSFHDPMRNFMFLLLYAKSNYNFDYILFSDQDDIWKNDKIEKTINALNEEEKIRGKQPLLAHCDLTVVDSTLNIMNKSFIRLKHLNPFCSDVNHILIQNNVTGCTICINKYLLELIDFVPEKAIMHDWWVTLLASVYGKIIFVDEPLILYRQHGNNTIGAKNPVLTRVKNAKNNLNKTVSQAQELLKVTKYTNKRNIIEQYANIKKLNKVQRIKLVLNNRILKQSLIASIYEIIVI